MSHMVIFRDPEGRPGYHQAEQLDEAVRFVEELRNERQVNDARVFSMHEIPLEFKNYWRVEVTAPPAPPAPPVPAPDARATESFVATLDVADPIEPDPAPELDEEPQPLSFVSGEPSPVHSTGRFGIFGRS